MKTVLVLLPTFSQTIEQRICVGIKQAFAGDSVKILNVPLGYLPKSEVETPSYRRIHQTLRQLNPDIVLAYGGGLAFNSTKATYQSILDFYEGIPIVNMGFTYEGIPSIIVDNYHGMLQLMQKIVQRRPDGKILYVSGPVTNEDNKLRLQALRDALAEQGRILSDDQILVGDFTARVAQDVFSDYLSSTKTPANIIVCANDLSAKGVLDSIKLNNLRCPDDMWVTGYDDFEYAASIRPGLSTVHFPAKDLGIKAGLLAKQMLVGEANLPLSTVVPGYAVLRGTTGDEHPGLGDYDKQLSEQWALIHQRDNNARKLSVLRNFQRRVPLKDILKDIRSSLGDLQIEQLSLFVNELGDDGKAYVSEIDMEGIHHEERHDGATLPSQFSTNDEASYWLLCPLETEEIQYGYLVAKSTLISAEFVEFIAPQFTDLLHTEALEARNENYRLQNELNERMASLGSLVSGVAHEVNTPIGTGKLAASSLLDSITVLRQKADENRLTKKDFDEFLGESGEYSQIIFQSLDRAAELISNFKMVSVDQTAESQRQFDLGEYIASVLISLRHQLKGTPVELELALEEGVIVNTFPGAVAQVITNLFMNALKHGLNNGARAGVIKLELKKQSRGFRLTIADNGKGASKDVLSHVFDPFFTTTRGNGGSGLGMHIVFNLVSQKLNWSIQLQSEVESGFAAILQPTQN